MPIKILSAEKFTAHRVVTDKKDYPIYTRYSSRSWTQEIGESDEVVHDLEELEAEFQRAWKMKELCP